MITTPIALRRDVVLVSMPFGPLAQPSIGLSLLKAALAPTRSADVMYFTLPFAERIGSRVYDLIANGFPTTTALVGEWLFASAVYRPDRERRERYARDILAPCKFHERQTDEPDRAEFLEALHEAESQIAPFLDECTERILERSPRLCGFTTVFQQSLASIALALRIKARNPQVTTVFGGANCEGIMGAELLRSFPCIDATVSGEGEIVFPRIVTSVIEHGSIPADIVGVVTRENLDRLDGEPVRNAAGVANMDALPVPKFSDFMQQFRASEVASQRQPTLLFETSRGCWWGERSHCTFCGLNGANMQYRAKSADRALRELDELLAESAHENILKISAVDNILSMKYFDQFLPALAERKLQLNFFYEVKANLRKEQAQLLRRAGVTAIQPGIESLSTPVLTLMRKGVRAIQNVALLKWSKELGIHASWNLIYGFPGEDPADYAAMARLLPDLIHLRPPAGAAPIRLDRFSPNFDAAEQVGFRDVTPYPAYAHVFEGDAATRGRLAYYFTHRYADGRDTAAYTAEVRAAVSVWKKEYDASELVYIDEGSRLILVDTRPRARALITRFSGAAHAIIRYCDSVCSFDSVRAHVAQAARCEGISDDDLREVLSNLEAGGYIMRENNLYLSLAIEHGTYALSQASLTRFKERRRALVGGSHAGTPSAA